MNKSMDIYSKLGTRVRFAFPNAGYPHHQADAREYLNEGEEYTVERTEVSSYHTDVYLGEIPGVAFNSVMFAPVEADND